MSSSRKLFLFIALPLVIIAIIAFWVAGRSTNSPKQAGSDQAADNTTTASTANCTLLTPTDVSKVTGILYPGQTRGGNYKAHGGFRIDSLTNNVNVTAPLAAEVTQGSRYIEQGELQYMFDFKTDCGYDYRLDHLKTLSAKMQAAAETLPAAQVDDSRTTPIENVTVAQNEVIATAIGFEKGDGGPNVTFDFGLYSQKQKNEASKDTSWAAVHTDDQATHAVCWLDLLPTADSTFVKGLPGDDPVSGKNSDYCK